MTSIEVQNLPQLERVQTYLMVFQNMKGGKPMNDNYSTTVETERLSDRQRLEQQWKTIDWEKAEQEVNRLQARIVKATQKKNWNNVKRLQYLLTHSYYAKVLAVRKVTTSKGKNTAGIDGKKWLTTVSKMRAVLSLTDKNYKAKPLRRVYIDKKDKRKKRPISIPCMYDRAMQALYAMALDPVSEATADKRSFGFRKGRSCHDACEYIFQVLARRYSPEWVLEGDIKGCFDNISHEWLINNIPMDKSILKQFLKAGFIFKGELFPTNEGTPQGGNISTILANMTLDGIQLALAEHFDKNSLGKITADIHNKSKVNLVRYADDFIVTAITKEKAEEAKEVIKRCLQERGLELSEEKTIVTNINEGFDMLGWTFKKYNGKLIIKPSKKSIKTFVASLSETILKRGKAWTQELLIEKLNQQIRGWTNYHQSVCASETFAHIDYVLYELLWRWANRRHPHKGKWWISTNYWHKRGNRNWVFSTENKKLLRVDHIPIVRHIKVRLSINPYIDTEYFNDRKFRQGMRRLSGRFRIIWKNQNGICHHCGMPIDIGGERDIHFKIPKSRGGKDEVSNMVYVHKHCQQNYFECRSKEY